jgi:hypothetical protein
MIKATFETIAEAVEHARQNGGGWLFKPRDNDTATWYDASKYTRTDVIKDSDGSGRVAPWKEFDKC